MVQTFPYRIPLFPSFGPNPNRNPNLSVDKVRLSFRTDIGGMAENQDSCFIWRHEPSGSFVIGVLDVR